MRTRRAFAIAAAVAPKRRRRSRHAMRQVKPRNRRAPAESGRLCFPIDVVFIDQAQTIVKIVHSLGPWRTAGARGAAAALELPAGTAAALELEPGLALVLADFVPTS